METKTSEMVRFSAKEMEKQLTAIKALQAKVTEAKNAISEQKKLLAEAKKAEKEAKKAAKKPNRYAIFALILKETAKQPATFPELVATMQAAFPEGSLQESNYKVNHGLSFAYALNLVEKNGEKFTYTGK